MTDGSKDSFLESGEHLLLSAMAVILMGLLSWGLITANLPATVVAGVGIATVITMATPGLLASEDQRSQATERTLRVASATQCLRICASR